MTGSKVGMVVIGSLAGGWMIIDGIHVMLRGKYIGPDKPGPWSIPFVRLGIEPFRLGPMFVLLGACWILFLIAMLRGQTWGRQGAMIVAALSLWYVPLGTLLSLIYLGLIYFGNLPGR